MNLYLENILMIATIVFFVIASILVLILKLSKRKSAMYKKIIEDETTEMISILKSTEYEATSKNTTEEETMLMTGVIEAKDEYATEVMDENFLNMEYKNIEESVFQGKYKIEKEITGGGMSRVFIARNVKLGNKWIIKYINNKISKLADEESILKMLNHTNLPRIIDIFYDADGVYIVQTYIEGVALNNIVASKQKLSNVMLLDFTEQMLMVLSYLHNLKPMPIIHCDLKPSNIIITPDGKPVLIDFGISKKSGTEANSVAATYRYAAPEQLSTKVPQKYENFVYMRFGDNGKELFNGIADARTDIFSLGTILFEIATGQIPIINRNNKDIIYNYVSEDFAKIILKCIEINPDDRYSSIEEIKNDLQKVRVGKVNMLRSLFMRRVAFVVAIVMYILAGASVAGAAYFVQLENGSVIIVNPEIINISLKESTQIELEKVFENGETSKLSANMFEWTSDNAQIAQIDGNRLVGLNAGETKITGVYKNKKIYIKVSVIDPINETTPISLVYKDGVEIEKAFGTGECELIDGDINKASFVVPESIVTKNDGTIYIADAGVLRKIKDQKAETVYFDKEYIACDILSTDGENLYFISDVWFDENGDGKYGIFKVENNGLEEVCVMESQYTDVKDIVCVGENIYYVEYNAVAETNVLKSINLATKEVTQIKEIDSAVSGICEKDNSLYMVSEEMACIYKYSISEDKLINYAGVPNEMEFIDLTAPKFYRPRKIYAYNNALYIIDYNVVRKLTENSEDNSVLVTTVAGMPNIENSDIQSDVKADKFKLSYMDGTSLSFCDGDMLLTDCYNGIVYKVKNFE